MDPLGNRMQPGIDPRIERVFGADASGVFGGKHVMWFLGTKTESYIRYIRLSDLERCVKK